MKPLDKAIEISGGLSELAKQIGTSANRLGNWRSRGVPIESCYAIEQATGGQVTRKDLRPDDWESIWPELAQLATQPEERRKNPQTEQQERETEDVVMRVAPPDIAP